MERIRWPRPIRWAALQALFAATSLFPGSGFAPAKPGQYVTVYATGFGLTNPAIGAGVFFAGLAPAAGTVRVLLNGQALPDANVLYAGATPSSPGLYQLNLLLWRTYSLVGICLW